MENFDISSKFNAKLKSKVDLIRIQKATEKTRFIENYERLKSFVTQSLDKGIFGQTRGKETIFENNGAIEYSYKFGDDIAGFMSVARVINGISSFYCSNAINQKIARDYGIRRLVDCKGVISNGKPSSDSIRIEIRLVNAGENPDMYQVIFYLDNIERNLKITIEKCGAPENSTRSQINGSAPRKVKIIKRRIPNPNHTTTVREVWHSHSDIDEEPLDFTDSALAVISAIFG